MAELSVGHLFFVSLMVWMGFILRENSIQRQPETPDQEILNKDVPPPKLNSFTGPTLTFLIWFVLHQFLFTYRHPSHNSTRL